MTSKKPLSSIIALTNQFGTLSDLAHKFASLEDLANRDLCQSTLNKVSRTHSFSLLTNPYDHLLYHTYNILAFSKLYCFTDSSNELYTLNN
ncbi:hypothetical protein J1N35_000380 [Gossypium stocksii]|uniref:Uncharacterized protein n=1 Tax=Gossypium stocksii TaxID=47602 RepID=A0A9D4AK31_9ROSI|nr:hypothetical protein J1N35_000380 [Gossypium stocksii]